ncbi:uncharacterized protein LOC127122666 [Lathyrus oleraceus]|uniref:uncharacterized protein LOC127122666 n=1 Tax=Pisum sativum TaxID=3888 RepID=UPI0021D357B4|nr:uncharacterized protein LOC127122666 [Pisum sativum]
MVSILFDLGATHSCISISCAEILGFEIVDLNYKLTITSPPGERMVTCSVCADCPIILGNRRLLVDLVVLPLQDLNVILGMDWLSTNDVNLGCKKKILTFGEDNGEVIKVETLTQKFMMLFSKSVGETPSVENFPVVCEFPKFFPEDVPGLPPVREVEFAIDLIPGTRAISIAPYQRSTSEVAELKKQLDEMLEKEFIIPSVSMWRAPILFDKDFV